MSQKVYYMKKKKISVVMTTYNGEKYILQQMRSIMKQDLLPDEVLILDDCSTDSTVEIVKQFIKENSLIGWKCIRNTNNVGYKKNFYNGIKMATGDYIFLCDQDDEWNTKKVHVMADILDENPQITAINCGVQLIDGESTPIATECRKNHYNCNFLYSDEKIGRISYYTFPYIMKHNISPGCTMAMTKSLRNDFLKCYTFDLPHDWFLNLLASADYGCVFVNEPLVNYRRHESNQIGANTGALKGITTRTRSSRISGIEAVLNSCNAIVESLSESCGGVFTHEAEIDCVKNYLSDYLDFFKNPSVRKMMSISKRQEYKESTRSAVRKWNWIVSLRLDNVIIRVCKLISSKNS